MSKRLVVFYVQAERATEGGIERDANCGYLEFDQPNVYHGRLDAWTRAAAKLFYPREQGWENYRGYYLEVDRNLIEQSNE